MEQLGSHYTDFHEILYPSIFRKIAEKIHVSVISEKNNSYFTRRPIYIFDNISLRSSKNELFQKEDVGKIRTTHFMFNNVFFFENRAVYDI